MAKKQKTNEGKNADFDDMFSDSYKILEGIAFNSDGEPVAKQLYFVLGYNKGFFNYSRSITLQIIGLRNPNGELSYYDHNNSRLRYQTGRELTLTENEFNKRNFKLLVERK